MNEFTSILGIAAALLMGAASPGPSFLMIARTAASAGRVGGVHSALGMGLGALLFAVASLLGLNAVLLSVPTLYAALKIVGGLYLAYLGFRIWREAKQALHFTRSATEEPSVGHRNHLLLGFTTQVSNPKTAMVYASVFAAFMPSAPSIPYNIAVIALVFFIEAGWYAVVATVLSAEVPRATYLRYKHWVDRLAGGIMGALGIKLAASASQQ